MTSQGGRATRKVVENVRTSEYSVHELLGYAYCLLRKIDIVLKDGMLEPLHLSSSAALASVLANMLIIIKCENTCLCEYTGVCVCMQTVLEVTVVTTRIVWKINYVPVVVISSHCVHLLWIRKARKGWPNWILTINAPLKFITIRILHIRPTDSTMKNVFMKVRLC